jgi:hypothetical protein
MVLNNEAYGESNSWVMNRKVDETYILDKQFRLKGRATRVKTNGIWWTENGKYYQDNTEINPTDVFFTYQVINSKKIAFKSTSTEEDYEYTEQTK